MSEEVVLVLVAVAVWCGVDFISFKKKIYIEEKMRLVFFLCVCVCVNKNMYIMAAAIS